MKNNLLFFRTKNPNFIAADGPLYCPRVAIVSLAASCQFDFGQHVETVENADERSRRRFERRHSLALRPRSLLIFEHELYTDYLHTIADEADRPAVPFDELLNSGALVRDDEPCERERERRVSLTIRVVPRVLQRTTQQ